MDDRAVVERQLGRAPRAFSRVAVRCPFGRPAVTEQVPYDAEGNPFPTTFWLTCPHLVRGVSRLEAAGGVERWTRAAHDDPVVKPYRSFLNLAEGKVICVMEAPGKEALAAWFGKMQMPCDYITPVELEGERSEIKGA